MQDAESLKINALSKQYMEDNLERMMYIERDYPKIWLPENFLMDLPLKWELSRYTELDKKPVGFIIASLRDDSVALHRLMVDPDYRDRHIGGALYGDFEAGCREVDGVRRITLHVMSDNTGGIRFYERLGYRIFDETSLANHYGMEKILNS